MPASEVRKSWLALAVAFTLLSLPVFGQTLRPTPDAPHATLQVNDLPPGQTHLTPAQSPPKDPEVSFKSDVLTVVADNSTLSAILRAVEKNAGIKVHGSIPEDRMFGKFGPGSPRDVLTQLFSGSHIDYILQGNTNPNSVQSVTINNRGSLSSDMFPNVPTESSPQILARQKKPVLNSDMAGGQEPENTNGYTSATDQSGTEENGYQPGQVPPPPTQQQLLDRLHQMQQQQGSSQSQTQPDPQ